MNFNNAVQHTVEPGILAVFKFGGLARKKCWQNLNLVVAPRSVLRHSALQAEIILGDFNSAVSILTTKPLSLIPRQISWLYVIGREPSVCPTADTNIQEGVFTSTAGCDLGIVVHKCYMSNI